MTDMMKKNKIWQNVVEAISYYFYFMEKIDLILFSAELHFWNKKLETSIIEGSNVFKQTETTTIMPRCETQSDVISLVKVSHVTYVKL